MQWTGSGVVRMGLAAGLVLGGAAFGQSKPADKPDRTPLRGPSGDDKSPRGEQRPFSNSPKGGKEARDGLGYPPQLFMQAVGVLRQEGAAEPLSAEQEASIKKIMEATRASMQAFKNDHAEEIRALASKLSPEERRRAMALLGGAGDARGERAIRAQTDKKAAKRPPTGDDAMTEGEKPDPKQAEEAKARLREIMAGAPKVEDSHKSVYALLTNGQRASVDAELARLREAFAKDRDEKGRSFDKAKDEAQRKLDKKDAPAVAPEGDAPTSLDDPRVPERLRERIKNLPEDQQARALRRAWERLKQEKK